MQDEDAIIEAKVQERVAAIMAQQQQSFALMMEQAVRNALAGVDEGRAALEAEHQRLMEELDEARSLHAKADREGEQMATAAFEKHRREYAETIRIGLLRDLTRLQIEGGRTTSEIMKWLNVEQRFVEKIREVVDRVNKFHAHKRPASDLPVHTRIRFVDQGRSGLIYFESSLGSFDMWWELGYGALAFIAVPDQAQWVSKTGIGLEHRRAILNFIGQETVAKQTHNGYFIVGDSVITVYADERDGRSGSC